MTKKILAISLTAIFAIAALAIPLGIAEATEHLSLAKVVTGETEFERIMFKTMAPLDPGTPFGYGIISDNNYDSVLVITTHKGVLDSEAQFDVNDASFHSHYVTLIDNDFDSTCGGLEVESITWQEPATVNTRSHAAIMNNIPYDFSGTNGSDPEDTVSFVTSGNVTNAVTFTINQVDGGAICINDVTSTDQLSIKSSDERTTTPAEPTEPDGNDGVDACIDVELCAEAP